MSIADNAGRKPDAPSSGDGAAACPALHVLDAFVNSQTPDDRIAAHVAACEACRGLCEELRADRALLEVIRHSKAADGASFATPEAGSRSPPARGMPRIEGYELLSELQRGGQGIVYRARQLATSRDVAVKVLLAGALATSPQRRRFDREIELVAGLDHPNIVTVHDSGATDDGSRYCAMQLVEGVALDGWLANVRRSPLPRRAALRQVLRVFIDICDAVSAAHQRGIMHRDLKPSNVLIAGQDHPYVLDFGLARPADEAMRDVARDVTAEGSFLGTLNYAAPEQTLGDSRLVDVRSDVYALGAMLYEALADRPPCALPPDPAAALRAIREAPPGRLRRTHKTNGEHRLPVDRDLEAIVFRALAKEPNRRYQSAAALRDDLRRYLDGRPVLARHDSTVYVIGKLIRRHRAAAAAAALILALIGFSLVALSVQNQRVRREAEKVRQINIFLEDTLGSAQPPSPDQPLSVADMLHEAELWIDVALDDQPDIAAAIRNIVGNSYRNIGELQRAEMLLLEAVEARKSLVGESHPEFAQSLNALALLRQRQGRFDEARDLFERAISIRTKALGDRSYEVSLSLANLAALHRDQGRLPEAARLLEESMAIREGLFGREHQDVAMCLYALAETRSLQGDDSAAEQLHREALAIRRRVLHGNHPDLQRSLFSLAATLANQQRFEEARALLIECLALQSQTLSPDHWLLAVTRSELGRARANLKDFDAAEVDLLESIRITQHATSEEATGVRRRAVESLIALYEKTGRAALADRWRAAAVNDFAR